ncbi:hypothetical protein TNCV_18101 [Trichonephila clavipes]|nr:hypothetical protein TNCV_18101 [Trichonephila clavipes]
MDMRTIEFSNTSPHTRAIKAKLSLAEDGYVFTQTLSNRLHELGAQLCARVSAAGASLTNQHVARGLA